jgi:1-deoxy-D-xylulose-5-phosphate synthase
MLQDIQGPSDLKGLDADQLKELADEIRAHLIASQARTGGHIGPNLGVVELTLALHYVFDSPNDQILWDVGHQVYVHKMLTGRLDSLKTMRQDGGSPGFPCRAEGPHDLIDSSHGGETLSLALGLAISSKLRGTRRMPIAVIGDGALPEGVAQEALNQIGDEQVRMLIVLNDNDRSIDASIGAIHNYLTRLRPGGDVPETLFSSLGIDYVGPIDGHDLDVLVPALQGLQEIDRPTILHVKTEKGRGLPYAADNAIHMHFSFPFDPETGEVVTQPNEPGIFYKPSSPFNTATLGGKICELVKGDPDLVVISPATRGALELHQVFREVPDRCFDVSMAEQHAVALAAGLAGGGMKPMVCFQSTFFQRSFDQLVHDVCANELPVLFLLARSGLAGLDHSTHHSPLDLSYLRCVPNLRILFPTDHSEFQSMLESMVEPWVAGPTALLLPYGTVEEVEPSDEERALLTEDAFAGDNRAMVLASAGRIRGALGLKRALAARGIGLGVLPVVSIKPLDEELMSRVFDRYDRVVTMEENVADGGLGGAVCEFAADHGFRPDIIRVTLGDRFVEHGTRRYLYERYRMDEPSILARMEDRWPDLAEPDSGATS